MGEPRLVNDLNNCGVVRLEPDCPEIFVFRHHHQVHCIPGGSYGRAPSHSAGPARSTRMHCEPAECPDCGATLRIIALINDPGLCEVYLSDECTEMAVWVVNFGINETDGRVQRELVGPMTGSRGLACLNSSELHDETKTKLAGVIAQNIEDVVASIDQGLRVALVRRIAAVESRRPVLFGGRVGEVKVNYIPARN